MGIATRSREVNILSRHPNSLKTQSSSAPAGRISGDVWCRGSSSEAYRQIRTRGSRLTESCVRVCLNDLSCVRRVNNGPVFGAALAELTLFGFIDRRAHVHA